MFFVKGQIMNIFGFVSHIVSFTTTRFYCPSMEVAMGSA